MPSWLALTEQEPGATSVRVVPFKVQAKGVPEANVTARPELALAARLSGAAPMVWLAGEVKLMV